MTYVAFFTGMLFGGSLGLLFSALLFSGRSTKAAQVEEEHLGEAPVRRGAMVIHDFTSTGDWQSIGDVAGRVVSNIPVARKDAAE